MTVAPKDLGIMMRDPMVRALLLPVTDPLHKTVTRRTSDRWASVQPGRILWVRECWAPTNPEHPRARVSYRSDAMAYGLNGGFATGDDGASPGGLTFPEPLGIRVPFPKRWRPSMNMPRWASRITLRVVSVRQEYAAITTAPQRCTLAEGLSCPHPGSPLPWVDDAEARREGVEDRAAYLRLWEAINGAVYPAWVWRIEFEEVERG